MSLARVNVLRNVFSSVFLSGRSGQEERGEKIRVRVFRRATERERESREEDLRLLLPVTASDTRVGLSINVIAVRSS